MGFVARRRIVQPAADIHHYNLSRSVTVQCSEPGHYPGQLHIEDFLTGFGVDGHTCWAYRVSREHDGVRPGEIMRSGGAPTSRTERRLAKHLAGWFVLADEDMNTIKFAQAFMTYPWGKPDIIIPGLRVAVEFDGTGAAGVEDGHDTDDGKTVDILKDELMREVGWEVVRVRTSGMPRLGPFDVQAEAISPGTVREFAWMVLRAADSLDTLDANLHALSERPTTSSSTASNRGSVAVERSRGAVACCLWPRRVRLGRWRCDWTVMAGKGCRSPVY